MKKILFLQPKEYFERLGLNFDALKHDAEFGVFLFSSFARNVSSYSCVVSCIDHSHFNRLICMHALSRGVPAALIMDGVFEWSNATENKFLLKRKISLLSPFCYSHALVVDEQLNSILNKKGVESMRYVPGLSESNPSLSSGSKENKILVTTANTAYFNDSERDSLVSLLKEVVGVLKRKDIPYFYRIFDRSLLERLGDKDAANNTDGDINDVIEFASAVITTPSTLVSKVVGAGVPVALLDYRDGPIFMQTGWRINGASDIAKTIDSLIAPDESRLGIQFDLAREDSSPHDFVNSLAERGYFVPPSKNEVCSQVKHDIYVVSFEYWFRCMLVGPFSRLKKVRAWLKKLIS